MMMGTRADGRNWLGFKDETFVIGKMKVSCFSYCFSGLKGLCIYV